MNDVTTLVISFVNHFYSIIIHSGDARPVNLDQVAAGCLFRPTQPTILGCTLCWRPGSAL